MSNRASGRDEPSPVAFYCASSSAYLPGAVALINSLRLHGHREPIYLLDCGLTPAQRELVSAEAVVVAGGTTAAPHLLKTIAPRSFPAARMVLLDVDMVATRQLGPLIDGVRNGVTAFANDVDRFVSSWGEELGLGRSRRLPYVSSGLVLLGGTTGWEVLELWDERVRTVDFERGCFAAADPGYSFLYLDQDVLNAVLGTRPETATITILPQRLAPVPPFRGLRLRDLGSLRCSYSDGTTPYVVHHFTRKPWLEPMHHGLYSKLLTRLWFADDLALPLPAEWVPRRLRPGPRARVTRARVGALDIARRYALAARRPRS